MGLTPKSPQRSRVDDTAQTIFHRASELWDAGKLREAKQTYEAGAHLSDPACQTNLAYFYEQGIGTRKSLDNAKYWYRRATRRGDAVAAHNLGILYVEAKRYRLGRRWLKAAVKLGEIESCLELGKLHLDVFDDKRTARRFLRRLARSRTAVREDRDAALQLLRRASDRR